MSREQILGLVNPSIALIFAATFFIIWTRQQSKNHVLAFAFAYLMLGSGFLISHLVGDPGDIVHVFGTHVLYSLGTGALIWAVCTRSSLRNPLVPIAVVAVIALLLLMVVQLNSWGSNNARLYISNTSYGLMFVFGAWLLRTKYNTGSIERLLFWMLTLTALQFFVRPVVTLTAEGAVPDEVYRDSVYYSVLNVTVALLSLMLALSLIASCVSDIVRDVRLKSDLDILTGLKTRRAFEDEAAQLFDKLERTPLPLSLVVGDIDHFKSVNDRYGHQGGDLVISEFGKLFGSAARQSDSTCRYGGEEFCALLWNADLQGAKLFAESVRSTFANLQIDRLPKGTALSASFGVATAIPGESFEKLFARADKALYEAKNNGRNKVVAHGPGHSSENRQLEPVAENQS